MIYYYSPVKFDNVVSKCLVKGFDWDLNCDVLASCILVACNYYPESQSRQLWRANSIQIR
jgi:hypothetical protein